MDAHDLRRAANESLKRSWGCTTEAGFQARRKAIIDEVRAKTPGFFAPNDMMKQALAFMFAGSDLTQQEQLEQMAFDAWVMRSAPPSDINARAKETLHDLHEELDADEIAQLEKIVDDEFPEGPGNRGS